MLSQKSLEFIKKIGEKHGVQRIVLFGSCLHLPEEEAGDIDLAVGGLDAETFVEMWNDLTWAPELHMKNVDLVRMEDALPVMVMVRAEGVTIYERERERATVSA